MKSVTEDPGATELGIVPIWPSIGAYPGLEGSRHRFRATMCDYALPQQINWWAPLVRRVT